MLHLFVITALAISKVNSQAAYCAFNRGVAPIDENNAGTYNFLNGEFIRDTTSFESGGQTLLWQGMPYYKMVAEKCFVPYLYLYRHIDHSESPSIVHWVISPNVGTKPEFAFAYCGPDSGVTTAIEPDLASPVGACDGNWMIGDPKDPNDGVSVAEHVLDSNFKIMYGGCPQITCSSVKACSASNDEWATTVDTSEDTSGNTKCDTYSYVQPNIYKASNLNQYYMFFNIKTMRWAWQNGDDDITVSTNYYDYNNCELYKAKKGFEFVADVNTGGDPYALSTAAAGGSWLLYFPTGNLRYAKCIGTVSTPSPTTTEAPVPTRAPVDDSQDICQTFNGGQLSPTWQAICGLGFTPQPTVYYRLTASPTDPTAPSSSSGSTPRPTTANPTDQNGTGKPTTPNPTVAGGSGSTPTAPPSDSGANTINCNMYVFCILMAVFFFQS